MDLGPCEQTLAHALPFVAENGFALDVSQHVALCGATWRRGNLGATNDVMARSLAMQAPWAAAARGGAGTRLDREPKASGPDAGGRTAPRRRRAEEGARRLLRD